MGGRSQFFENGKEKEIRLSSRKVKKRRNPREKLVPWDTKRSAKYNEEGRDSALH